MIPTSKKYKILKRDGTPHVNSTLLSLSYFEAVFPKVYQRESWPKKIYLCDTGLTKTVKFSEDMGKLVENAVYLELLRQTNKKPLMEIYYWKNLQQAEVDFLLKEGTETTHLIQVTYA